MISIGSIKLITRFFFRDLTRCEKALQKSGRPKQINIDLLCSFVLRNNFKMACIYKAVVNI